MKKLLIRLASDLVIDLLLQAAREQLQKYEGPNHVARWTAIINFLLEVKEKGLPL